MLNVITVKIDDRSYTQDLIDSFEFDAKVNNYKPIEIDNAEELKVILGREKVQVVFKDHRYIGFFFNPISEVNKEVSLKIFRNPRACPFAARSLMKAAVLRAMGLYLQHAEVKIDKLEFMAWHPSLVSVSQAVMPGIKNHQITPSHFICLYQFDPDLKSSIGRIAKLWMGDEWQDLDNFGVIA